MLHRYVFKLQQSVEDQHSTHKLLCAKLGVHYEKSLFSPNVLSELKVSKTVCELHEVTKQKSKPLIKTTYAQVFVSYQVSSSMFTHMNYLLRILMCIMYL